MADGAEAQPAEAVQDLLEHVVEALGLDATVTVEDDGEVCTGTLHGADLGLFIGRHGQTIDAVQHLAQRVCKRRPPRSAASSRPVSSPASPRSHDAPRIVIDAADYRERREAMLQRQADQAAEDALRQGRPVALDAMTASERRLVHEYLRERGEVQTYSEGDEPDRHLVVAPLD